MSILTSEEPSSEEQPPEIVEAPPEREVRLKLPAGKPIVTYTTIGITALVYILQVISEPMVGFDLPAALGMKVNRFILDGELWRLITPILLHGSLLHIGFNMYALNIYGPALERFYGHGQFLALYLISGFTGFVASFAFTDGNSLGASTAIFGLLGAYGVFAFQNKEIFGESAQRILNGIIRIGVINLILGLSPGIDNWGHLGGLIGGLIVAWFGGPVFKVVPEINAARLENQRTTQQITAGYTIALLTFGGLAFGVIFLQTVN
ncbi:MAG: rhomboid family intramembrane serine protease [Chloroflexota bacterium]